MTTNTNSNERRALAALLLHVTGNLGKRDGNPYSHRVVREAVEALFPGQPWSEPGVDAVRAAAVDSVADHGPKALVLSLIVKGDPIAAQGAASSRRIPAVVARVLKGETVLHAPAEYVRDVAEWFHEAPHAAPFEPGTLLHYGDTPTDKARNYRNVEVSQ